MVEFTKTMIGKKQCGFREWRSCSDQFFLFTPECESMKRMKNMACLCICLSEEIDWQSGQRGFVVSTGDLWNRRSFFYCENKFS